MAAFVLIVVLLLALPATAGAVTASVQQYWELPDPTPDDSGGCGRYAMCPRDMVVVDAAPAENNHVVIAAESSAPDPHSTLARYRFVVTDEAGVQAGPGCEQLEFFSAACTAAALGFVWLGDGDDSFASKDPVFVDAGPGQDLLQDGRGRMIGGAGDDVIVGRVGFGGAGDDVLAVEGGRGGSGDDVLRCFPRITPCTLRGDAGDDLLIGGASSDEIFAGRGADRVDCGPGSRDRAVADRRDTVRRCERAG